MANCLLKASTVLYLFISFAICRAAENVSSDPQMKTNLVIVSKNDNEITNSICDISDHFSCDNINLVNISETKVKQEENVKNVPFDILELMDSFPKVIVPTQPSTEQCRADVELLLNGVKKFEMWALKMIDSTAKLPSGILHGNINQYGDFDQCLSIKDVVEGKYCLASLQITLQDEQQFSLREVDQLLHALYAMRSNMTDPGHRVPRFSSIMWGVCMPKSCSGKDLEAELKLIFKGLNADVLIEESNCVIQENKSDDSIGKKITRFIFLALISLLIIGTLFYSHDIADENLSKFEKILRAFSIKRNYSKMVDVSGTDDLRAIDGARSLNATSLLIAHKSMAALYNPYINRVRMAEVLGMPWSIIGRTSIIYTDTFLLISGLLNARGLLKDLEAHGKMNFFAKLRSRIFRLLPLLTAVILFCTYILPEMGSGPQWKLVIEEHSHLCKVNMWRNFLFIHNFFGFPPMCLTHTHQIGIDMQLFLATPLIVWLLWNRPKAGILTALVIGAISTYLRYYIILEKNMSMVVFFGISVDQLFKAANYSYTLPTHRATIYLMGVLLAYFMHRKESHLQFSKATTWVFWTFALTLGFLAQLGPWKMGLKNYEYEQTPSAKYAAYSPIIWGIFLSWSIWASNRQHGGWFGDLLTWRGFKIFSKIAYAFYLVQFPIFFYNVGLMRTPEFYKPQVMFEIPEVLCIILISIVVTLCIEMPFMEIHNILFNKNRKIIQKDHKCTEKGNGLNHELKESKEIKFD